MRGIASGTGVAGLRRTDVHLLGRPEGQCRPVRPSKVLLHPVRAQLVHPRCCSVTRTDEREAILCSRFKAHESPVLAMLVKTDEDGGKELITSSLDKTMALWKIQEQKDSVDQLGVSNVSELKRMSPSGAPIFSLAEGPDYYPPAESSHREKDRVKESQSGGQKQVFCGNADRTVVAWSPPEWKEDTRKEALSGHDGWVRALATYTTSAASVLLSAACNQILMWQLDVPTIKLLGTARTPKDDVLVMAISGSPADPSKGRLYTGSNNGTLRVYSVVLPKYNLQSKVVPVSSSGNKEGNEAMLTAVGYQQHPGLLEEEIGGQKGVLQAHMDRITGLVYHKNFLYSVSRDGTLKMWDSSTLELLAEVPSAHNGAHVTCICIGPDDFLYTGGADNFVRRWTLGELLPAMNHELYGHNYPVRSLAAGNCETLVSADAGGEVAVWRV